MLKEVLEKKLQELNLDNLAIDEFDEILACGIGSASACAGEGTCGTPSGVNITKPTT